jgi:hypothetical protein
LNIEYFQSKKKIKEIFETKKRMLFGGYQHREIKLMSLPFDKIDHILIVFPFQ